MALRKNVMLCCQYSEKRLLSWPKPWLVQPKINGRRCLAVIKKLPGQTYPQVTLLSSQGNEIKSVPHINNTISLSKPESGTWDGELYRHGLSFEWLASTVGRKAPAIGHYDVNYHVFDHVEPTYMQYRIPAKDYVESSFVRCVPTIDTYSVEDVERQLSKFISAGYEGIIIRHPMKPYVAGSRLWMMKLKPVKQIDATIVGFKEERTQDGERKNKLGAIECEQLIGGGRFWVGSGFTESEREFWWDNPNFSLIGRIAKVKFQDYTSKGVPYFTRIVKIM